MTVCLTTPPVPRPRPPPRTRKSGVVSSILQQCSMNAECRAQHGNRSARYRGRRKPHVLADLFRLGLHAHCLRPCLVQSRAQCRSGLRQLLVREWRPGQRATAPCPPSGDKSPYALFAICSQAIRYHYELTSTAHGARMPQTAGITDPQLLLFMPLAGEALSRMGVQNEENDKYFHLLHSRQVDEHEQRSKRSRTTMRRTRHTALHRSAADQSENAAAHDPHHRSSQRTRVSAAPNHASDAVTHLETTTHAMEAQDTGRIEAVVTPPKKQRTGAEEIRPAHGHHSANLTTPATHHTPPQWAR